MSKPSDEMCAQLAPKLAGAVDFDIELTGAESAHVDTCLRCQAEVASYRKLLRAMHGLRTQVIAPTPGVLAGILNKLGEDAERRAVRSILTNRRIAYGGAIAIAASAGVTGAILLGRGRSTKKKAA